MDQDNESVTSDLSEDVEMASIDKEYPNQMVSYNPGCYATIIPQLTRKQPEMLIPGGTKRRRDNELKFATVKQLVCLICCYTWKQS